MPPRHFDSANGMINAGWRKVGNRQRLLMTEGSIEACGA
jgi:hypothetical protein